MTHPTRVIRLGGTFNMVWRQFDLNSPSPEREDQLSTVVVTFPKTFKKQATKLTTPTGLPIVAIPANGQDDQQIMLHAVAEPNGDMAIQPTPTDRRDPHGNTIFLLPLKSTTTKKGRRRQTGLMLVDAVQYSVIQDDNIVTWRLLDR